jgi:hypothetical protein
LVKEGNRLKYTTSTGDEIKQFRKEWERNEGGCLDTIMNDWINKTEGTSLVLDTQEAIDEVIITEEV